MTYHGRDTLVVSVIDTWVAKEVRVISGEYSLGLSRIATALIRGAMQNEEIRRNAIDEVVNEDGFSRQLLQYKRQAEQLEQDKIRLQGENAELREHLKKSNELLDRATRT